MATKLSPVPKFSNCLSKEALQRSLPRNDAASLVREPNKLPSIYNDQTPTTLLVPGVLCLLSELSCISPLRIHDFSHTINNVLNEILDFRLNIDSQHNFFIQSRTASLWCSTERAQ